MPKSAPTKEFGEYKPDLNDIGSTISVDIVNVYPREDGYGPFKSLQAFTSALPAACRGFFFARKSDGSIAVFAGTSTDLYLLDNTTFAWVKVSKGGVSYSALSSDAGWQFVQFNDLVVCAAANTVPQKYTLASGGNFADLGGSPPTAAFVAVVGFFLVLSGLVSNPKRLQWSDLGAPESWTAGVGLSDFQDMSDGGNCGAVAGGDIYGVVFQQESLRKLTYAPGSATVFDIARLSTQETLYANSSIINVGNRIFYIGASGFKMIVGNGDPVPIGKERVDRFFFENVDASALQLVLGASDPTSTRVYWACKTKTGQAGLFDMVWLYDYALNKWTRINVSGEYLASLARPGLTLEQLDAIAPGGLTVLGAANNGVGNVRLTLDAVSNATFQIAGQNFIVVQGVAGTTEANGTWLASQVTIVDSTHIDLAVPFVHAWTAGGRIGGSLDALGFSLDSISKAAAAELAAFGPAHDLGFFAGPNLEAVLETGEGDPQGNTVEVNGLRPMTDCATAYCSVGMRMNPSAEVEYSPEVQIDDQGWAEAYVESRYVRGRLRCPAGSDWSYATGIQPDVGLAGEA